VHTVYIGCLGHRFISSVGARKAVGMRSLLRIERRRGLERIESDVVVGSLSEGIELNEQQVG